MNQRKVMGALHLLDEDTYNLDLDKLPESPHSIGSTETELNEDILESKLDYFDELLKFLRLQHIHYKTYQHFITTIKQDEKLARNYLDIFSMLKEKNLLNQDIFDKIIKNDSRIVSIIIKFLSKTPRLNLTVLNALISQANFIFVETSPQKKELLEKHLKDILHIDEERSRMQLR